jgi:hypothetical protein
MTLIDIWQMRLGRWLYRRALVRLERRVLGKAG